MRHSVRESNVKLPSSRRLAWRWLAFLALGLPMSAQEPSLPPNIVGSSGPVPGTLPSRETPGPSSAIRAGEEQINPRFLGAASCSSSLCHGGGSAERNAYTVWAKSDPHRRAAGTLAGTYAKQIARGLSLASAAGSARCTECHVPLATLPAERLAAGVDPTAEGISCEVCHGPAQNWLRSHTRRDFSHAQNVQTGVREVRGLYERAGTCVACHQVLPADVLDAGHPALFFELDAQTIAEPRHWIDPGDFFGPQAWLTGQAVAWRELSWALNQGADPSPTAREQWQSLAWLLRRTTAAWNQGDPNRPLPRLNDDPASDNFTPNNLAHAQAKADELSHSASHLVWTRADTRRSLLALAATDQEFLPTTTAPVSVSLLRGRAQRLAAGLSRLAAPLQKQNPARWTRASGELDQLFSSAPSQGAFDGAAFGEHLRRFYDAVAALND